MTVGWACQPGLVGIVWRLCLDAFLCFKVNLSPKIQGLISNEERASRTEIYSQHCVKLVISKIQPLHETCLEKKTCHSLSSNASDKPNPKSCFYSSASLRDWHVIFTQHTQCLLLSSSLLSPLCPNFAADVVVFSPVFSNLHLFSGALGYKLYSFCLGFSTLWPQLI